MPQNLTKLTPKAFDEALAKYEEDNSFGYAVDPSDIMEIKDVVNLVDAAVSIGFDSYYVDDSNQIWFFSPEETESLQF